MSAAITIPISAILCCTLPSWHFVIGVGYDNIFFSHIQPILTWIYTWRVVTAMVFCPRQMLDGAATYVSHTVFRCTQRDTRSDTVQRTCHHADTA